MDSKFSLSEELYGVIEKQNSADTVCKRETQRDRSDSACNQQFRTRNECFSAPINKYVPNRHNHAQRSVSVESNPQKFGYGKKKESFVMPDSACSQRFTTRNESFSAPRKYFPNSHNHAQRSVSVERNPQKFRCDNRKESSFVQPRRDFNRYGNDSSKAHPRDRSSISDYRSQESYNKPIAPAPPLNSGSHKKEKSNNGFGYNRLKTLSTKEPTEIVMVLTSNKDEFFSLLKEKLTPDKIMLVVKILAKISASSMEENKAAVLAHSVQPYVLEMFSSHSHEIVLKDFKYSKNTIVEYFENLAVFYKDVIEILPNTAIDHLKEHLKKTIMGLQSLKNFMNINVSPEFEQKFADLLSTVNSMAEARKPDTRNKNKTKVKLEWKPPGTDFREVSIFPLPQDVLLRSEVPLSPVVVDGPYKSVEHYLNVHFHLMREDFIIPLRFGIMDFIEQNSAKSSRLKRVENVRFYKRVQFLTQFVEGDTLVSEVLFDPTNRLNYINWKRSKRFMYGSLVCFSSDSFKTLFLGIITNRDVGLLEKGILQCELIGDVKENLFEKEFTMAENEIYFEAYQHVLKALKFFNETNFPLQEYIIGVSSEVFLPNYLALKPDTWYDFGDHDFQVLNPNTWPSNAQLKVNESQLKALNSALTRKLVVIQGPPGTGKTYLGLIIAKLLLENSEFWRQRAGGPILVVCYTNHALDQFLEGILTFTDNIVRVGGQSKNEKMGEYNLKFRRKKRDAMNYALMKIDDAIDKSMSLINQSHNLIKELLKKCGIISLKHLKPCMGTSYAWFHVEGEYKDSLLIEWLLEGAYFHNDSNSEAELYDTETVPENMTMVYACSLSELQAYILQLNSDIANAKGYDFEYIMSVREIYKSRFIYLKRKLMEPVNKDMGLINQLNGVHNLSKLDQEHRWVLYNYWVSKVIQQYHEILTKVRNDYERLNSQKSEIIDAISLQTMSNADVVGITTTGAARQQTLLQKLGAKIVIVEEAAEVMESHVVVSLSDQCEHLILIGDHKQLRPSPAVYKLAKDYNFDISLFERMLKNNVPYDTLDIQHRMRPEIADLIIPAIYPALNNHETVLKYDNILGIKKNLFFITHTNPEELVKDGTSKKNVEEARFLIALCRHIILQGYDPTHITILAVYVGQMFTLMEERDNFSISKDVRISCVDNFQGEENDIILLSLVRNNEEGKVGFLATDNRVCVALSRAKKGLYIMGNIDMLSTKSSLWRKVREVLEKKEAVGTHLQLQCLKHHTQITNVCKADDFIPIREGGCTLMCNTKLNCGHICKKMCHMIGHENFQCNEICGKKMCVLDHRCQKLCWEKCGDCMVPLQCKLPCDHVATLPCHKDPSEHKCKEVVSVQLPDCKHTVEKECHVKVEDVLCSFPCDSRLPCGHVCERNCHVTHDPEHLEYKCLRPCGRKNLECKDEHMCQKKCYEECSQCTYKVRRQLPNCEHFYDMDCSADPGFVTCRRPCKKMLPCGHKCPLKCVDVCGSCAVVVEKEIPDCKHKIKLKCSTIPVRHMCTEMCERSLQCGHPCKSKCGLPCTSRKCDALLNQAVKSPCGHEVRVYCHESQSGIDFPSLLKRCLEPCSKLLECSHRCKGTCGGCLQGRIHIPCREKCGKNLICGHECTVSCSQSCPPCKKQCFIKCQHSKCTKKCGAPCVSCKEKCGWRCEHFMCKKQCGQICDRPPCNEPCKKTLKCGHPCIGYCGEKCPPLCRVCDAEEIDELLTYFGTDDENARFVLLPDCGCVLASEALEKWLEMDPSLVKMKVCPKCTTPIQNVYRVGNIIKQHFINVIKVKCQLFRDIKTTKTALSSASSKLYGISKRKEFVNSQKHLNALMDMLKQSKKQHLDMFVLNSLEIRTQFVLSIAENFNKIEDKLDQSKINDYIRISDVLIKIILKRLDFISSQEQSDIKGECMRLHLILQLGAVENSHGFKAQQKGTWYKTYERCKNLLSSLEPFPQQLYQETFNKINELYKLLVGPIGISKVEMLNIVKAVNLHQGHWYTCPNGHVYVIADCGQAMQEGRCYECGERIGGTLHRLHHTNRSISNIPQGI